VITHGWPVSSIEQSTSSAATAGAAGSTGITLDPIVNAAAIARTAPPLSNPIRM
jgi:hypothetical protein